MRGGMEDANSSPSRRPGGPSRTGPPGHFRRSFDMELLNHLVAAKLMKTAQRFERFGADVAARRLSAPSRPRGTTQPTLDLVVDNSAGDASPGSCLHQR
jgi:hypothetical protein